MLKQAPREENGTHKAMLPRIPRPGVLLAFLGSTTIGASTVFTAKIVSNVNPVIPSILMYSTVAYVSAPKMITESAWLEADWKQYLISIFTGVLSGGYILTRFEAMAFIAPADSSALFQTQLIFVIIIARVWLKEVIGIFEAFFMSIILVGTFLVTQPESVFGETNANIYQYRYIGIILTFAAAIITAVMSCIVRSLNATSPFLVAFLQGFAAAVTLLIYGAFQTNVMPTNEEWIWVALAALCGASGVIFFTIAFMVEEASLVTALMSIETLVALLLQVIFLNTVPNWITAVGIVLLMVGVTALPLKRQLLSLFVRNRQSSTE